MSAPVETRPLPTVEPPGPRAWRWWMAVLAIVVLAIGILVGRAWTGGSDGDVLDPIAPVEPTEEPAEEPTAETPPAEDPETPGTDEPTTDEPTDDVEPVYAEEPRGNWDIVGVAADDVLNVRSGPGTGFEIIATLAHDAVELESTGRIATVGTQTWRELVVPGDGAGWVNARYTREHRPDPLREDVGVGLPMDARLTAQEVFTFADRGDLDSLARLALDGDVPFTASFGQEFTTPAQLVAYWERIGADEVTGTIRALVLLPDWYVTTGSSASGADLDIHVTPRFMHEPTAANRAALEDAIGRDAVEAGLADGQWLGWRMGISEDGVWRFFVRGD